MNPQYLLIIAVAIIMGWFALGTIYNVRRGEAVVRWMQTGLPRLGERTTFRWLGSSVIEMVINQAHSPAKRAEVLAVLAPRDVPWSWIIARARGRRDILIIRLDLVHAPRLALELADPTSWTGRMAVQENSSQGWVSREYAGKTLLAPAGLLNLAEEQLEKWSTVHLLPANFHRFGLRKDPSRLEIHLPFPNIREADAAAYFKAVQEIAKAI